MTKERRMPNINDTYFDGFYKEIWKTIIPAELTVKEVDFMISYFQLGAGSSVLDLMCGYGRHTLALAAKGIPVTAVDNLGEYVAEIKSAIAANNLPATVTQADVLSFHTNRYFDLALCMGNSLNFFNASDTITLFMNTSAQLKPGGHLLINSWSIAEIVYKNPPQKSWSIIGDVKYLNDIVYQSQPSRLEIESIFIAPDGKTESKKAIDYIFSLNELGSMLQLAGMRLKEVFSIPGRKKFTLGEPRAYIVAEKIK